MGKKGLFERLIRGFKKKSYRFSKPITRPYHHRKTYTVEEKLQILKELEESTAPISVFAKWKGTAAITIQNWQNAYKTQGEKGLESKVRGLEQTLPAEVIDKIVRLKTENPGLGSPKIAAWLARHDFIKVSANAILKLLKRRPETKDLVAEAVEPKNEPEYQPKTFERSNPRQMYQMDITNWHLKGLYNVYIIACLDDYSRYIAQLGYLPETDLRALYRRLKKRHRAV